MGISADERRMIDGAIEAGRVTRIPEATGARRERRMGRQPDPKVAERREGVLSAINSGQTVSEAADALGLAVATVRADIAQLRKQGHTIALLRSSGGDRAVTKKLAVAERKTASVRDRRRFKVAPVPMGTPAFLVPSDTKGSRFPDRVFDPDGSELVLKDGANSCKIGGDVLVGRLKGAYIATLTLEERATCPRDCALWRSCYGNGMQHARRWRAGQALEDQLREEVALACEKNRAVLIRLHVLGDFYSWRYLCLWAELLDTHDNLHAFGFTAWKPGTKIGDGIARLRGVYPDRFMIRHSGMTGKWGAFTLDFPTEAKTIGDAVVCPEQVSAMNGHPNKAKHCGNCAVCWQTDRPIAFVEH